tara:strand:+ start:1301 stop:1846 length:546 start_codon:yes stop_codon:yes gene_type:complete
LQYFGNKNWYALRVKSQCQRMAHLGLNKKKFEVLNPLFNKLIFRKDRKKILTKPIFKGYMFIRTFLYPELHLEILKTPGVVEILKNSYGPVPIPNEQIENIQLLEKHVGECFFATGFAIGDAVLVREGPLTGLKGIIERIDRKRLHIHLDAIPGSVMIEVNPNQVQYEKDSIYQLVEKDIY